LARLRRGLALRALVVKPAVQGVDEPLVAALPLRLGLRLFGLQRIIDHDDAGPTSGQHPTGGGDQVDEGIPPGG